MMPSLNAQLWPEPCSTQLDSQTVVDVWITYDFVGLRPYCKGMGRQAIITTTCIVAESEKLAPSLYRADRLQLITFDESALRGSLNAPDMSALQCPSLKVL